MDTNNNQTQQNSSAGLLRYRSVPNNFLADEGFGSDKLISRFMAASNNGSSSSSNNKNSVSQGLMRSSAAESEFALLPCSSSLLPPQYPRHGLNSNTNSNGGLERSYGMIGSMAMGTHESQVARGVCSNSLMRQNSSPAGFFSHISLQNGYPSLNGVGSYGGGFSGTTNGDMNPCTKRLKSQMSLSSGLPSSLGVLSRISEVANEGIEAISSNDGKIGNGYVDVKLNSPEFPYVSWGDTSLFSDNVTVMKTEPDIDGKLFSGTQNGELGNRIHALSHHLSLPKTSADLVSMENILQFQDAVPCKIRAKRGCATHPRSIAERMRRTRISERMRKLQELVPNMDKQTNTADMLDMAVEYIKDLQKQFKTLSDSQAKCKCKSRHEATPNQAS